jgi:ribosome-binding protein aMBF1 (putative translation factor)
MIKLDEEKLRKLPTVNDDLDAKYGKKGTPERNAFDEESLAWFYGSMFKERRKELKLTQKQVADRVGCKQSYIARIETGHSSIQMSSFFRISNALGISFTPSFT